MSERQQWQSGDTAQIGSTEAGDWKAVKVMAVADGYAMVRIPWCAPFVVQVREPNSDAR